MDFRDSYHATKAVFWCFKERKTIKTLRFSILFPIFCGSQNSGIKAKRYLDPKADLTFKRVFGEHPDLVVSLPNALLPLNYNKETKLHTCENERYSIH